MMLLRAYEDFISKIIDASTEELTAVVPMIDLSHFIWVTDLLQITT